MGGKVNVFSIGGGGVNLVKDPLQLADNELTQAQNAELVLDANSGGAGALSKRGGLAALNASPLAGSVTGMVGLTLKTSYTRTLYAARGTANSNTFKKSADGSSWTDTATPVAPADSDKFTDANGTRDARRIATIKNYIVYPGNGYTKGTTKPVINVWDGTNALTMTDVPFGPDGTADTPAFAISDMLTVQGKVYLAVHDAGGAAPSLEGRVLQLDLVTGVVKQIATAFGNGTGEVTGGYPSALAWHQGKLWVGLNGSSTTDAIGKVVNCRPDTDTTWTSDVTNLRSHISSLCVFKGDLYAGTQSSVSTAATITKRSASAGTWATQVTSGAGAAGNGHYASLIEYNSELYAVEYWDGVSDTVKVVKSTDGTTWSTSRDIVANDSPAATPQFPAGAVVLSSKLYIVFRATTATATDGFIMQNNAGSWTKVSTDNFAGPLATLVERT